MKINARRIEVFLEFLIFGVIMGVIEDIIAISFSTDIKITFETIWIVTLVAIPFAFIGEILVDRIDFIRLFKKSKK